MQETRVWSLDFEDPLEEGWQSTSVFLPRKSRAERSLVGYSPRGRKELDMKWLSINTHKGFLKSELPARLCDFPAVWTWASCSTSLAQVFQLQNEGGININYSLPTLKAIKKSYLIFLLLLNNGYVFFCSQNRKACHTTSSRVNSLLDNDSFERFSEYLSR